MDLKQSTGLRNFVIETGSYKMAFEGGVMMIYEGAAPSSADAAVTGTLLSKVTKASGSHTAEVLATGLIALTGGASGNVSSITIDSYEILGATVSFDTDLTTTAANIVKQINRYTKTPNWVTATSSGTIITLSAINGTGTTLNGKTIAVTSVTITTQINGVSSVTMGGAGATAGVASVNGLEYNFTTTGKFGLNCTASGVNLAGGIGGYFRVLGSVADSGVLSTTLIRLQGTVGSSGADYNLVNTTFELGATHTVATDELTMPAST